MENAHVRRVCAAIVAALVLCAGFTSVRADEKKKEGKVPPVLNFKMKSIDGKSVDLSNYQGKVVVFVNVASKCGYTPQYEALQKLYEKYADKGLVIVGVPANDFGKQEPGTDAEIKEFCSSKYNVKFDMLSKVSVKGDDKCDLYKFLTSKETDPKYAGEVEWNFEKFIVSRNGEVVGRFKSKVKPDSDEFIKAIETELDKK
jgi:glutathione peroxidase